MRFAIMCAVILFVVSPVFADTIYLNDGSTISGKVLRVTDTEIEFSTANIPFDKQSRSKIKKIVYTNGKTVVFNEKPATQPVQTKKSQDVAGTQSSVIIPLEEPKPTEINRHDGFYLGFMYGYGYGKSKIGGNNKLAVTGFPVMMDFTLGYAVAENFILFTELRITMLPGSEITYNGKSYSPPDKKEDVANGDLGFGFRSYIMPENMYVSASLTASTTSFEGDFVTGDSKTSLGYFVAIGKEWWVSTNWGLGVSVFGEYNLTSYTDANHNKDDVTNYAIGLAFSATYN
jgi:hypothetical protein